MRKCFEVSLVQCFSKEGAENQVFPDLLKTTQKFLLAGLLRILLEHLKKDVVCNMEGKKVLDEREAWKTSEKTVV